MHSWVQGIRPQTLNSCIVLNLFPDTEENIRERRRIPSVHVLTAVKGWLNSGWIKPHGCFTAFVVFSLGFKTEQMFSLSCGGPGRAPKELRTTTSWRPAESHRSVRRSPLCCDANDAAASIETTPPAHEHVRVITKGWRRCDSCEGFWTMRSELSFHSSKLNHKPRQECFFSLYFSLELLLQSRMEFSSITVSFTGTTGTVYWIHNRLSKTGAVS